MSLSLALPLRRARTGLRLLGWALLHWALGFAAQVIEVLAPAALAAGAAWWAVPRLVGFVPAETPMRDVLTATLARLPGGISLGGVWVTPAGLLLGGLGLMALAALLQTVSVAATELAFRRR